MIIIDLFTLGNKLKLYLKIKHFKLKVAETIHFYSSHFER